MKASPPTTTMAHESTLPSPPPLLQPRPKQVGSTAISTHPVHKTLACTANLANLLPTGTVMAFQTLAPSFSNKGVCQFPNKFLTASLVVFCSIVCFLSSFTDSFTDCDGKLYYGIATFKGLYILNRDQEQDRNHQQELILEIEEENIATNTIDLSNFRISLIDFLHAFASLFVFLVFAFGDGDMQRCVFPLGGENLDLLMMNLPLAAGVFSSFLFMIFPTTRRGIGYSDMPVAFK